MSLFTVSCADIQLKLHKRWKNSHRYNDGWENAAVICLSLAVMITLMCDEWSCTDISVTQEMKHVASKLVIAYTLLYILFVLLIMLDKTHKPKNGSFFRVSQSKGYL